MRTAAERFFEFSELAVNGCWSWIGYKTKSGYGTFSVNNKPTRAHRWIYEQLIGVIPEGLEPDHLCRNRACVNPYHLELVTPKVNKARGKINQHKHKTHCKNGHEFSEANTQIYNVNGGRNCRICKYETLKKWRSKNKMVN